MYGYVVEDASDQSSRDELLQSFLVDKAFVNGVGIPTVHSTQPPHGPYRADAFTSDLYKWLDYETLIPTVLQDVVRSMGHLQYHASVRQMVRRASVALANELAESLGGYQLSLRGRPQERKDLTCDGGNSVDEFGEYLIPAPDLSRLTQVIFWRY